jgi:hypothetical protein
VVIHVHAAPFVPTNARGRLVVRKFMADNTDDRICLARLHCLRSIEIDGNLLYANSSISVHERAVLSLAAQTAPKRLECKAASSKYYARSLEQMFDERLVLGFNDVHG